MISHFPNQHVKYTIISPSPLTTPIHLAPPGVGGVKAGVHGAGTRRPGPVRGIRHHRRHAVRTHLSGLGHLQREGQPRGAVERESVWRSRC